MNRMGLVVPIRVCSVARDVIGPPLFSYGLVIEFDTFIDVSDIGGGDN